MHSRREQTVLPEPMMLAGGNSSMWSSWVALGGWENENLQKIRPSSRVLNSVTSSPRTPDIWGWMGRGAFIVRSGREAGQAKTQPPSPQGPLWDNLRTELKGRHGFRCRVVWGVSLSLPLSGCIQVGK